MITFVTFVKPIKQIRGTPSDMCSEGVEVRGSLFGSLEELTYSAVGGRLHDVDIRAVPTMPV
jgi:hypothetical protein